MDDELPQFFEQLGKAAGKSILSLIPVVGPITAEVFGVVFDSQVSRRQIVFLNEVAERLKILEDSGLFKIENIHNNDKFIDVTLEIVALARKTSNRQKIEAFQNTILNTACRKNPTEFYTHTFLQLLDRFTHLHLAVLKVAQYTFTWFMDNDIPWVDKSLGISTDMWRIEMMLWAAIPETNGPFTLDLIWKDLQAAGLVDDTPVDKVFEKEEDLYQTTLTLVGMEFNNFVNDPINFK